MPNTVSLVGTAQLTEAYSCVDTSFMHAACFGDFAVACLVRLWWQGFDGTCVRWSSAANILEKLKDAIEEACELAESKPQLFLLALRLIHGSSWGEDSMNKALQILTGLKQLPAEADVSALAEPEEA